MPCWREVRRLRERLRAWAAERPERAALLGLVPSLSWPAALKSELSWFVREISPGLAGLRQWWGRRSLRDVARRLERPRAERQVVFIAEHPTLDFIGAAMALKERPEYETVLLVRNRTLLPLLERHFDVVYAYSSGLALAWLLARAHPWVVHVQGVGKAYWFGIVARALCDAPLVVSLLDVPSLDRADWERRLREGEPEATAEAALERFCHQEADGIVAHCHSLASAEAAHARHGGRAPVSEFQAYCCREHLVRADALSREDGRVRVAYAGVVPPRTGGVGAALGEEFGLWEIVEYLTTQGIEFHLFPTPHVRPERMRAHLREWVELEARNPLFHFHDSVPPDRIARALCRYDFGIMLLLTVNPEFQARHVPVVMPSKLYRYLEAGVGILTQEEEATVAVEVRRHGIGLVATQEEMRDGRLGDILRGTDLEALRERVARAREDLEVRKHVDRLLDTYAAASALHRERTGS